MAAGIARIGSLAGELRHPRFLRREPGSRKTRRSWAAAYPIRHSPFRTTRLRDVRVTFIDKKKAQSLDRTLKFRIDAVLWVEPLRERGSRSNSALEIATDDFRVGGAANDGRIAPLLQPGTGVSPLDGGGVCRKKHSEIAGRLRSSADGSHDPHVERIVEAFAYLNARIRFKLRRRLSGNHRILARRLIPALPEIRSRPWRSCGSN